MQPLHELRLFRGQKRNGVLEPIGRVLPAPRLFVAAGALGVAAAPHNEDETAVFGCGLNLQLRQVAFLMELVHCDQQFTFGDLVVGHAVLHAVEQLPRRNRCKLMLQVRMEQFDCD